MNSYMKYPNHLFRIGNKVYFKSGSPELNVVDFTEDEVTCAWRQDDGKINEATWPHQCIMWLPVTNIINERKE